MALSQRAIDLVSVIATQARSGRIVTLATLSRALPHDPDWIAADLRALTAAHVIALDAANVGYLVKYYPVTRGDGRTVFVTIPEE